MLRAFLLATLTSVFPAGTLAQPTLVPYAYEASFEIAVPEGWVTVEDQGMMRMVTLSPSEDADDAFRENVNVVLDGVPSGMTPTEYAEQSFALLAEGTEGLEIVASDGAVLGGRIALRSIYEHSYEGRRLRVMSYLLIVGRRAYVITATAPEETFERYVPIFEAIASSFNPG